MIHLGCDDIRRGPVWKVAVRNSHLHTLYLSQLKMQSSMLYLLAADAFVKQPYPCNILCLMCQQQESAQDIAPTMNQARWACAKHMQRSSHSTRAVSAQVTLMYQQGPSQHKLPR